MATSKEFHDYIVDNLQRVGDISTRKMMGEYLLYFQGKLVGEICDNCLFLKPTDSALMSKVLQAMYAEIPDSKKRK